MAEPVIKVGDNFIDSSELNLGSITPDLSDEEKFAMRQQNTRALIGYLEQLFTEQYLEETSNKITEVDENLKIDESIKQTHGSHGFTPEKYKQQFNQMADIAELLEIYERSQEEAELVYSQKYADTLTRAEWDQIKQSYSKSGFQEMEKSIAAAISSESQIQLAHKEGQARTHVLNQEFSDVWSRLDMKYSDWREERFSEVQILIPSYFEAETLASLFSQNKTAIESESPQPLANQTPSSSSEIVETVEGSVE